MSEELISFDIGPAERAPGVPFENRIPRCTPDPAAAELGLAFAAASSEEEALEIYLAALVKAGFITEVEADEVRAEIRAECDG